MQNIPVRPATSLSGAYPALDHKKRFANPWPNAKLLILLRTLV